MTLKQNKVTKANAKPLPLKTAARAIARGVKKERALIAPNGKLPSGAEMANDAIANASLARLLAKANAPVTAGAFGSNHPDGSARAFLAHVTMARVGKKGVGGLVNALRDAAEATALLNGKAKLTAEVRQQLGILLTRADDARTTLANAVKKYLDRAPECIKLGCKDCEKNVANPAALSKL